MNDNLKNKKYLISSGCSYGQIVTSLIDDRFSKYVDKNDDVFMIDLAKDSQSSGYSADSIIYCVNLLLTEGVDSKNIFVLNEWTTFNRTHEIFPSGVLSEIESLNGNNPVISYETETRYDYIDNTKQISSLLDLKKLTWKDSNNEVPISIIDNLFYISPSNIVPKEFKNTPFKEWVLIMNKSMKVVSNETLMISYINNIVRLQNFLKLNKIKYKFHTINSQFSYWNKSEFGHIEQTFQNPYELTKKGMFHRKEHSEYINSLNESNDIVNAFPGCKSKFNEIDLSNFWFYEKNNYRFGGIDEYAFDNYGNYGYSCLRGVELEHLAHQLPTYCNHPEVPVYFLLAEELLEECEFINMKPNTKEIILSKIKEDSEADVSINDYVRSKLEMKEIVEKQLRFINRLI